MFPTTEDLTSDKNWALTFIASVGSSTTGTTLNVIAHSYNNSNASLIPFNKIKLIETATAGVYEAVIYCNYTDLVTYTIQSTMLEYTPMTNGGSTLLNFNATNLPGGATIVDLDLVSVNTAIASAGKNYITFYRPANARGTLKGKDALIPQVYPGIFARYNSSSTATPGDYEFSFVGGAPSAASGFSIADLEYTHKSSVEEVKRYGLSQTSSVGFVTFEFTPYGGDILTNKANGGWITCAVNSYQTGVTTHAIFDAIVQRSTSLTFTVNEYYLITIKPGVVTGTFSGTSLNIPASGQGIGSIQGVSVPFATAGQKVNAYRTGGSIIANNVIVYGYVTDAGGTISIVASNTTSTALNGSLSGVWELS
jgi:hypothetical protein